MSFLLAIESSGKNFSAALFKDGRLLAQSKALLGETASQNLLPHIQKLLSEAGIAPKDLATIAVGEGPGGFTGLRVGLSTAVGLATFHEIPIVGVSTLKAMALGSPDGLVASVLPAGRGLIYAALFRKKGKVLMSEVDEGVFLPEAWEKKTHGVDVQAALAPEASLIGLLALQESPPPMSVFNIKIKYLQDPDFGLKHPS
ncbi:MAG: tRNA (adenosine(37)-N6)-threonylcarbamoyltransferase complex dimerization subunit type 1 TsaB [Deltaproteobacteria bacterium]|nr:tRNA (adenosine(37)-N6)-threonylcarbamoyltransferase complex dimerization subunit type 1 TsaB [Deltaproteobacteria bacterium]